MPMQGCIPRRLMDDVVAAEKEQADMDEDYVPNENMNVNAVTQADRERLVCRRGPCRAYARVCVSVKAVHFMTTADWLPLAAPRQRRRGRGTARRGCCRVRAPCGSEEG